MHPAHGKLPKIKTCRSLGDVSWLREVVRVELNVESIPCGFFGYSPTARFF